MNVFEVVKENVTARQAAEAYGLKVGRTGMACCPFHSDKSPSMKLDERYYCFGCGATGTTKKSKITISQGKCYDMKNSRKS